MNFVLILFFIFVLGCSPKYKVEKLYHFPVSKKGKECIKSCKKEMKKCKDTCEKKYSICLKNAIENSKQIYKELEKSYEKEYQQYLKRYAFYLKELEMWQNRYMRIKQDYEYYYRKCFIDKSWCDERDYYKKLLEDWERKKPYKPYEPKKPDFERVLNKQQNLCDKDCNCQNQYEICFQECGGKLEIKRICVENCQ